MGREGEIWKGEAKAGGEGEGTRGKKKGRKEREEGKEDVEAE